MKLKALFLSILTTTTSFAADLLPNGVVSDWNAMNTVNNYVVDTLGINFGVLNNVINQWDGNGAIFNFNTRGNTIAISDDVTLTPQNSFSISSWVRVTPSLLLNNQTILSKIQRNSIMSASDLTTYDATNTGGAGYSNGLYQKTIFDGRYVYSVSLAPLGSLSRLVRYDTQGSMTDPNSWAGFTMYTLKQGNDVHWYSGYNSMVFDGRYIYLVPTSYSYETNHGFTLRYDTQGPIDAETSWTSMDIRSLDGANDLGRFKDGSFDGKYIYYTGGGVSKSTGQKVARYDTALKFNNATSWTYQAINTLLPAVGTTIYNSTVLAGNYLYFIPYNSGIFVKYDIRKPFSDPASWVAYDATNTNGSNGNVNYSGGTFDGRYIHFSPGSVSFSENLLRYDTTQDFSSASAWSSYSVKEPLGNGTFRVKAYGSTGFDGRYVYHFPQLYKQYVIPNITTVYGGRILRYDTTQDYASANAWTQLDLTPARSGVNLGVAFDQRYFYMFTGDASSYKATLSRLDTASNSNYTYSLNRNATPDISSTALLGPNFSLGTSDGYFSLFTNNALTSGWHLLTGVYDGSTMSLYVDTNLAATRNATGTVNTNTSSLLIGSSFNNSFSYLGDMNKIQVYNQALRLTDIKKIYLFSPYGGSSVKSKEAANN